MFVSVRLRVTPFAFLKKGSPEGNPIGVQTRTFSESKEQKKVCKSTTYTLFEQLRTVLSGERGIRTPGGLTLNGFQDRRNRPLCHLSAAKVVKIDLGWLPKIDSIQSYF